MTTASEATPVVARRIAIGAAAVLAIYLAFVETTVGQRFDDAAKLYAVTKHVHYQRLETLASLVAAAAGVMVLGAHLLWARRSITAFAWTAAGVVPPWLIAEIGKQTIPRGHLHPTPHWIGGPSFPSGHVAFTAGCVLTMVLLAPSHRRHAVAAVATLTLMVSMTLVLTSGMHRPSDAYAAPVLALAWIAALAAFVTPSRPLWTSRTRRVVARCRCGGRDRLQRRLGRAAQRERAGSRTCPRSASSIRRRTARCSPRSASRSRSVPRRWKCSAPSVFRGPAAPPRVVIPRQTSGA